MSAKEIDDIPTVSVENALHNVSAGVVVGDFRGDGTVSGAASGSFTSNVPPTLTLRGLDTGRTLVLVNGKRCYADDLQLSGNLLWDIPTDRIERVEVLRGGASAIYGSDALNGVVNFILKREFQEGYQGFTEIVEATGITESGARIPLDIANNNPDWYQPLALEGAFCQDYNGPEASKPFQFSGGSGWIGNSWTFQEYTRNGANFGSTDLWDVTPFTTAWQLSDDIDFSSGVISPQTGAEVGDRDQPYYLGLRGDDAFAQSNTILARGDLGQLFALFKDGQGPELSAGQGSSNIQPFVNVTESGPWKVSLEVRDSPAPGSTIYSGGRYDVLDAIGRTRNASGTQYFLGSETSWARIQQDFSGGIAAPFDGEAFEVDWAFIAYDWASNPSAPFAFSNVYNTGTPTAEVGTFTGDVGGTFQNRSTITLGATFSDDLEIAWGAAAKRNPTLGLEYFEDPQAYGQPGDDDFTASLQATLKFEKWWSRIEWTTGPYAGNGFYDFNEVGAGTVNTAGTPAVRYLDKAAYLPPQGTSFAQYPAVSLFGDQSFTKVCRSFGGDCGSVATSTLIGIRGWVPAGNGQAPSTTAQVFGRKSWQGRTLLTPLGDAFPTTSEPFPGGEEIQARFELNADLLGLTSEYDGLTIGIQNPEGDWYMPWFWDLEVVYGQNAPEDPAPTGVPGGLPERLPAPPVGGGKNR